MISAKNNDEEHCSLTLDQVQGSFDVCQETSERLSIKTSEALWEQVKSDRLEVENDIQSALHISVRQALKLEY